MRQHFTDLTINLHAAALHDDLTVQHDEYYQIPLANVQRLPNWFRNCNRRFPRNFGSAQMLHGRHDSWKSGFLT